MKVVKCSLNHFFDADKYSVCPECGSGIQSSNDDSSVSKADNNKDIDSIESNKAFGIFKKRASFKDLKRNFTAKKAARSELKKTIVDSNSSTGDVIPSVEETGEALVNSPDSNELGVADVSVGAHEVENTESSLKDETPIVSQKASGNDGETVGFFSAGRSDSIESNPSEITDSETTENCSEEPVVGWLVCIEGPNIGKCFNVYAGKNSLGRSSVNKITINKDKSISREKHTWIIYEPKHRDFFAQPGDSSGLTYVNDEVIMQATKLEKKSIIEVGNTKLMLIPLCDEEFSWEQYF